VAIIEALMVLSKNNYGTIGNTAYVSGYLIFNIFFALILFFRQKNWLLRTTYILSVIIMAFGIRTASTRGAYVGLAVSMILSFFLLAILNRNKKVRFISLGAVAAVIILIVTIFTNQNSAWVRNNRVFDRITQINFNTPTFQTRLISWKAAYKHFPNHPLLGTGFGNYAVTFDKFFDPTFYNYTAAETYFDRAHNNLVDIVSTSGSIGLLTYLSIFIAAFYYLVQGYRRDKISMAEFILLLGLMTAYFIQNLAVFDSLVTYMGLMVMLGYIYWLNSQEKEDAPDEGFTNGEIYSLAIGGIVMLVVLFQFNIRPLQMLVGTIDGQIQAARAGYLSAATDAYRKALSYGTVLDRDSRASLAQLVLGRAGSLYSMDKTKAMQILDFAIAENKKNVAYNSADSFLQMTYGQLLNLAASLNTDSQEKFFFYSNQAEEAIDKSIAASPGRVPIYYSKAQIYLTRGDKAKALDTLNYALSLNTKYPDSYCQLARVYFYYNESDQGYKNMDGCIDYGGVTQLGTREQVIELIKHYSDQKDTVRVIRLYERLTSLQSEAKVWANLSNLYLQNGQKEQAINAARKAIELDASFKAAGEEFIKKIEQSASSSANPN
jgi:tetratricopeptide (TPR) repeat protein